MREGQRHAWTLEQISADLTARAVAANFSSVFRAVERLVAERKLRKVQLPTGAARYEPVGAHHDHLHCSGCDALTPVPCLAANLDLAALEQSTGYAMGDHDIVLEGLCPRCRPQATP
jgi:Fur family ferric uptake transcriptional regulator